MSWRVSSMVPLKAENISGACVSFPDRQASFARGRLRRVPWLRWSMVTPMRPREVEEYEVVFQADIIVDAMGTMDWEEDRRG